MRTQSAPAPTRPALSTADRVAVAVAGGAAVFLVPWTVYLGGTLHHPGYWIAIDSLEAVTAGATAVLVLRRSAWASLAARIGAVVLLLDAYTDVLSARQVGRLVEALVMAVVVEVPLAVVAWRWASRRNRH
ncbi:hypothetical protein N864_04985 [Intrasporangium chromatireducens Q5-1]|uniref:Uncharacterized protein n=1 Tax=Intrasporangium chromatireducens Q5-1 TaxID=584657 RepID=W9GJQ2_9MICO|nr:hypothetical protein [Intrasporangium chromatireducens]EWT05387.1 hypothetical protein N864_04985 [Intrasporangium chromatireducens Q5-1]